MYAAAFARGDPHLVTLDGFKYTFNGHGEYTLIETTDNSFTLQGRMTQASGANETAVPATVFSAIVGKDNTSDTVQFETDKNGTLTAIVEGELVVFDISEQEFEKLVIKDLGNNSIEALFDSGIYIQAKGENGFISSLQVFVPEIFEGNVNGLLGNFNGNISDDLWPKFGDEPLSVEDSEKDIHNKFGITCELYCVYLGRFFVKATVVHLLRRGILFTVEKFPPPPPKMQRYDQFRASG